MSVFDRCDFDFGLGRRARRGARAGAAFRARAHRAARRGNRPQQRIPARPVARARRRRLVRHHRSGTLGRRQPRLPGAHHRHGRDLARLRLGGPVLWRAFQPVHEPDRAQRQRRAARSLPAEAGFGRVRRRARHERARRGLGRGGHAAARRESAATATPSPAARCGSPTAPMPTWSWSTPRPIPAPERAASPPSSSRRATRVSTSAQKLDKLGMRGSSTSELVFENCLVPAENVLGQLNGGVRVLMNGLDYERAVLGGGPLGLMAAALDLVLPYIHERKQFGAARRHLRAHAGEGGRHVRQSLNAARAYSYAIGRACDAGRCSRQDAAAAILFGADHATQMCLRGHPGAGRQRLHQRLRGRTAAARRQALRDRRRHAGNPPHADRPRALRVDGMSPRAAAKRPSYRAAEFEPIRVEPAYRKVATALLDRITDRTHQRRRSPAAGNRTGAAVRSSSRHGARGAARARDQRRAQTRARLQAHDGHAPCARHGRGRRVARARAA